MLRDERLELADDVAVPPELEVGLDPLLERGDAKLLQPSDLGLRELLERELGERGPTPELERSRSAPALRGGSPRICTSRSNRCASTFSGRTAARSRVLGSRASPNRAPSEAVRSRCGATSLRSWRALAPELVDEPVGRYDPPRSSRRPRGAPAASGRRAPPARSSSTSSGPSIRNSNVTSDTSSEKHFCPGVLRSDTRTPSSIPRRSH